MLENEAKNAQYVLEKVSQSSLGGGDLDDYLLFPRYLQLETINKCNARCAMCAIEEWPREDKYMNDDLFEKISNELICYTDVIERISIFMGGEPLLDKKLEYRILSLLNNGVKNIYFTTNGSLLDKNRAKSILESGVTQVDISIDSLKKEIYEKIRVNLNFDSTLENVLNFVSLRDSGNYKTRIRIRITEMLCNREEIRSMEEFWKGVLNLNKGDRVYAKRLNTRFVNTNVSGTNAEFIGVDEYVKSFGDTIDYNMLPCFALWNTAVILSDGRVGLCCVDAGSNVILGDLRKQSLKEVWRDSKVLLHIREKHLKSGRGSYDVCKNCDTWV